MTHYFSNNQDTKSNPKTINYIFHKHHFVFKTDHGVFSKDHVDTATDLLLNTVEIKPKEHVLDLGCGYGVIGTVLGVSKKATVTMVDVNERALALAKENADQHKLNATIRLSQGFDALDTMYDHIVSNPPIRIGKQNLYAMFETAKAHLNSQGSLWLVMHKKHGAKSAIVFLETLYDVSVARKQKGFHVIRCKTR